MENQRDFLQRIAKALDEGLNGDGQRTVGFVVLLYNFGEIAGGRVNYVGNGKREDVLVALKEIVARWEGRTADGGRQ